MICECGSAIMPYWKRAFTWCVACGKAYTEDGHRVPSQDCDDGTDGWLKNMREENND